LVTKPTTAIRSQFSSRCNTTSSSSPPHRRNRRRKTQDGRPLRRYRRRWKVERFFAWLNNFRRLPVRWEHLQETYQAFLELACIIILLRHL
jgi:transposase